VWFLAVFFIAPVGVEEGGTPCRVTVRCVGAQPSEMGERIAIRREALRGWGQ